MDAFGKPVASRSTERAERALAVSAAAVLLVEIAGQPAATTTILGIDFDYRSLSRSAMAILFVQAMSLLFFRLGDLAWCKEWNDVLADRPTSGGKNRIPRKLDAALERVNEIPGIVDKIARNAETARGSGDEEARQRRQTMAAEIGKISDDLGALRGQSVFLWRMSNLVFWIVQLLIPMALFLAALAVLLAG